MPEKVHSPKMEIVTTNNIRIPSMIFLTLVLIFTSWCSCRDINPFHRQLTSGSGTGSDSPTNNMTYTPGAYVMTKGVNLYCKYMEKNLIFKSFQIFGMVANGPPIKERF